MEREKIIQAIEDYSRASGLAPSTICQYALRNRKVYQRLKAGGTTSIASAQNLLNWMRDNPPSQEGAAQ